MTDEFEFFHSLHAGKKTLPSLSSNNVFKHSTINEGHFMEKNEYEIY